MYGVFSYIYHKNQPNVGMYTIHGSYGIANHHCFDSQHFWETQKTTTKRRNRKKLGKKRYLTNNHGRRVCFGAKNVGRYRLALKFCPGYPPVPCFPSNQTPRFAPELEHFWCTTQPARHENSGVVSTSRPVWYGRRRKDRGNQVGQTSGRKWMDDTRFWSSLINFLVGWVSWFVELENLCHFKASTCILRCHICIITCVFNFSLPLSLSIYIYIYMYTLWLYMFGHQCLPSHLTCSCILYIHISKGWGPHWWASDSCYLGLLSGFGTWGLQTTGWTSQIIQ